MAIACEMVRREGPREVGSRAPISRSDAWGSGAMSLFL